MRNNRTIQRFCKKVGRRLRCTPYTKHLLLKGLSEELQELPDGENASLSALENKVGTAAKVATELQESVSTEEMIWAVQTERRKHFGVVACCICVAVVLLLLTIFIFRNTPMFVVETIYEG